MKLLIEEQEDGFNFEVDGNPDNIARGLYSAMKSHEEFANLVCVVASDYMKIQQLDKKPKSTIIGV